MRKYIHEHPDWPHLTWDMSALTEQLAHVRNRQGRLAGRMESLGFHQRQESGLQTLTEDVIKSSEIEGEFLARDQVRSSIARRLGIDIGVSPPVDRNVEGVVEMMLDATQKFAEPLSAERLFGWHTSVFPAERSRMWKIRVGGWRDDSHGAMQVVSGRVGREKVHFEAPAAARLEPEMDAFLRWFNGVTGPTTDSVIKAALAHFWFVTIHPFDDGNGRIARAIADMALTRSEESANRFYSMSAQIRKERNDYYSVLELTQSDSLDITRWFEWFLGCMDRAIASSDQTLTAVHAKTRFWQGLAGQSLNDRQRKMLNLLLDDFDGPLITSRWARITKCSHDSALRDIQDLVGRKILRVEPAGGRSTRYALIDLNEACLQRPMHSAESSIDVI